MTPDGTLVAYITSSSRISQNSDRLFLWSSQSNAIVYGLSGLGFASTAISPDGHWLAYVTNYGSASRLFGVDRIVNTNFVISSDVSSSSSALRFDPASRYLAYLASTGPTSSVTQVYLFDFQTGSNRLVTQGYDGVSPGNDNSDSIDISSGGRFIAFRSASTNLVYGDTNGVPDVFLYDGLSSAITLISANRFGTASADNRSLSPVFSADAQTLVFTSWASDLVTNDFNYNADVFALKLSASGVTPDFSVVALPGIWLSWPASIGKSYRVQFKNNLDEAEWHDLTQGVSIMGSRASVQDAAQTSSQRFYRVLAY
jgi:Tol biopolymer transport system component